MATEAWTLEKATIGEGDEVANSLAARILLLQAGVVSTEQSIGQPYYVNGTSGDDGNDGQSPADAFATIGTALAAVAIGDSILISPGDYDENGLDLDTDGVQIFGMHGVTISNTEPATVLTISASFCTVSFLRASQAGQIGIHVTGAHNIFTHVRISTGSTTSWDIDGVGNEFYNCRGGQPTVAAFDIGGNSNKLYECGTNGNGATIGFYVNNGADIVRLFSCTSTGHATAGFQIDSPSEHCLVNECSSGGGDGSRIDNGYDNLWANFQDTMRREQHEHIYPVSDGEGTAGASIVVTNTTTDDAAGQRDDQDYWGDPVTIIPLDTITSAWRSLGIYIQAVTISDDQQYQIFFPQSRYCSEQDGGNDWDIDEAVLTVVDGTIFEVDDLVWMSGNDRPAGEILKVTDVTGNVVTIVSETRMGGGVGVRYDYDVDASANIICVVYRPDVRVLHGYDGSYSAASAKDAARYEWNEMKRIEANGAMIMRLLNGTDALATSMEVRAIYQDV